MKKILHESLQEFLNEEEVFRGAVETGLKVEDVDSKEFLVGLAIEKRHSTDLAVQRDLAIQNLSTNPKYYSEGIKKGVFGKNVEAMNLYKKYFIDKEDVK